VAESDFEREQYLKRESKLKGGVGIIRVGGASETEIFEARDRVIDAIHATRSALEEGIVLGSFTLID
jgi:chaperonin GroEL